MFFSFRGFFLAGLVFFQLGCDRFLRQQESTEEKNKPVAIEFKEGRCLQDVPQQLSNFFNDLGPFSTITICADQALKSFLDLTRGKDSSLYTQKELQDFFNQYLLKENKISDAFIKEIMKVKVLVAGGPAESATREELGRLSQFLKDLGPKGDDLQGFLKMISLKENPEKVDIYRINELQKKMLSFSDFLLTHTRMTTAQYQINDLNSLLENFRSFMGGKSAEFEELFRWMPLINLVRELLVGDAARLQTQKDWVETKNWLINSYCVFLRFHYVMRFTTFDTSTEKNLLIKFLDDLFLTIERSPTLKEKKIFEATKIDAVLDELVKRDLLKMTLPIEVIKESYRKAIVYFIESVATPADLSNFRGVTDSHIQSIKAEFNIWKASQVFINRFFLETSSPYSLQSLISFHKVIDSRDFPVVSVNDREEYNRAWWDFIGLFKRRFPLVHDDSRRLLVHKVAPETGLSFIGLSHVNFIRSFSRVVLRGYGTRSERAIFKRKMSEEDFVRLERDFHEFAVRTGLVDPEKTTSGKETFDQGKMLVFSANGDPWIDSSELTELFLTLYSGGRTILNNIYQDLENSNCLTQKVDVFGYRWADESCFLNRLRSQKEIFFPNLPEWLKYNKTLSESQFQEMLQVLLKVSRSTRTQKGLLESGEIRTLAVILHFVEEIFVTYDRSGRGLLTESDVKRAYPRFRQLIEEEAQKRGLLASLASESIYLYLVFNSVIPTASELITQWIDQATGSLGTVDRLKIYRLLGTMKDLIEKERSQPQPVGTSHGTNNSPAVTDRNLPTTEGTPENSQDSHSSLQQPAPTGSL
jgi:hypothetical protein